MWESYRETGRLCQENGHPMLMGVQEESRKFLQQRPMYSHASLVTLNFYFEVLALREVDPRVRRASLCAGVDFMGSVLTRMAFISPGGLMPDSADACFVVAREPVCGLVFTRIGFCF